MTQAKCFNCLKELEGVNVSMEILLEKRLPLFCDLPCSEEFPTPGNKEYEHRIKELKKKFNKAK